MNATLLFLVLIILSGGVIGMLADEIGRKVGKKRLSFIKMRPKHTARLSTFLAGVSVAFLTILFTFTVSSSVRDWIREGNAAIQKARELTSVNKDLDARIKSNIVQEKSLEQKINDSKTRLDATRSALASLGLRYQQAQAHLANASNRARRLQLQIDAKNRLVNQKTKLLATQQTKLAQVEFQIKYETQQTNDVQNRNLQLTRDNQNLLQKQTELSNSISSLGDQITTLKSEATTLKQANDAANTELAQTKLVVDSLKKEEANLNDSLKQLQATNYYLNSIATNSRIQPLIFRADEEIARVEISPDLTDSETRAAVENLIKIAGKNVIAKGGVIDGVTGLAALFRERLLPNGTVVTPADQFDMVVTGTRNLNHETVLVAKALINSFKGESVQIYIRGYNNPVVFQAGDVIARTKVAGKLSTQDAINAVDQFVKNSVVPVLLKKGMIPDSDDANSLLEVPAPETFQLVQQIIAARRPLNLSAVVKKDTRAADRIQVQFLLEGQQ